RMLPSHGNFAIVHVGDAATVYEALLREGVIVRPIHNYGLPNHLRVSIGLPEQNERLLQALKQVMTA
ncbi:MAG: aminotransferase class I/II-fold pyridoxal phosphate-dependent enzyme, partial [Gammaproteobacteria bacterium]